MRITDADTKHVDDLRALMADAKNKMAVCKEASGDLDSLLAELQQQKEAARDLVTETFHSYKAALEKRKASITKMNVYGDIIFNTFKK